MMPRYHNSEVTNSKILANMAKTATPFSLFGQNSISRTEGRRKLIFYQNVRNGLIWWPWKGIVPNMYRFLTMWASVSDVFVKFGKLCFSCKMTLRPVAWHIARGTVNEIHDQWVTSLSHGCHSGPKEYTLKNFSTLKSWNMAVRKLWVGLNSLEMDL